jgi:hypothetical protein
MLLIFHVTAVFLFVFKYQKVTMQIIQHEIRKKKRPNGFQEIKNLLQGYLQYYF